MSELRFSFGQALAILKFEHSSGRSTQIDLSVENTERLKNLREHVKNFQASSLESILQKCPTSSCQTESPFLQENEDFFIALVMFKIRDEQNGKHCNPLMEHLNDCFRCFEVYSEVMREYYSNSQNLQKDN